MRVVRNRVSRASAYPKSMLLAGVRPGEERDSILQNPVIGDDVPGSTA